MEGNAETTPNAILAVANQADSRISQAPKTVCYKMRAADDFGHVDKLRQVVAKS